MNQSDNILNTNNTNPLISSNTSHSKDGFVWRQNAGGEYISVLPNNQDAENGNQGLQQDTSSYQDGRDHGYSNISLTQTMWGQSSQNSGYLDVPAQNQYSSGNGFESGADYLPGYSSA